MTSSNPEVKRLKRVFGVVYFVQGMGKLPELSLYFFMLNVLKLGPVAGQFFRGLEHIAWFLKPIWGFISDRYPLFGYRRKSYFGVMAFLALISWLLIGLCAYVGLTNVIPYLILINMAQLAYAFVDVVADALMVEHGQRLKCVGKFVNFQWIMLGFSLVIVSIFGGWFQDGIQQGQFSYWIIFSGTGLFPLLTAVIGMTNLKEDRIEVHRERGGIKKGLRWLGVGIIRTPLILWNTILHFNEFRKHQSHILMLMLFIFVWNFNPSISYATQTYWVQNLNFTPMIMGILRAVSSVVWILSILFFQWFLKKFPSIRWHHYLYMMIVLGVFSLLGGYYYYLPPDHPLSVVIPFPWEEMIAFGEHLKGNGFGDSINALIQGAASWNRYHWCALFMEVTLGFASIAAWLIPLTLAGEAASKSKAGFTYALLMSVANATQALGDVSGGLLYKLFSVSWMQPFMKSFEGSFLNLAGSHEPTVLILQLFVYISAIFTFLAIPFVYWVKKEFDLRGIQVRLG